MIRPRIIPAIDRAPAARWAARPTAACLCRGCATGRPTRACDRARSVREESRGSWSTAPRNSTSTAATPGARSCRTCTSMSGASTT